MNTLAMTGMTGYKYSAGIAYVGIPSDLDRDKYIKDCYNNGHISIHTEDGGFYNRVPISPEVLSFIDFPTKTNELGSPLIYVTDELHQQPYIVARLMRKDELGDNKETAFKFRRKIDNGFVEISGSANARTINLLIDGDEKAGNLSINIFNKNKDSKLSVDVQGDVDVVCSGSTTIQQHKKATIKTLSDSGDDSASFEQSTTENKFSNKKLIVNDGQDPLALGNELRDFLSNFIDKVANIQTVTMLGLQPIVNKADVLLLKKDLDKILSKVIFTDK